MKFAARGVLLALVICAAGGSARAACINPPLSDAEIAEFKANPTALVTGDAVDARTVEAKTRDLAGSDATLATVLVQLADGARPPIRTAIAAGLAQATLACSTQDEKAAQLIQQAVAGLQNAEFQTSFNAVVGDLSTAAAAVAAETAAAGVGSVVVTNPNTAPGTGQQSGSGGGQQPNPPNVFSLADPPVGPSGTTSGLPVSATR